MDKIVKAVEWFDRILPVTVTEHPEKIAGFNGILAFQITGEAGGEWSLTIKDGTIAVAPGIDPASGFSVKMKDENFVKMMNGELGGPTAFMTGKLKFKGELSQAMKLRGLLFS